jgi:hypothetical protein
MLAIGFLRWLFYYQREEIQLFLEGRGINISTGEISNLSEEIQEARKPIRTFPQCPLVMFDARRSVILREFIIMIGYGIDDIFDKDVEKWLINIKLGSRNYLLTVTSM